ncbi:hypothetical protein BN1007_100315 [Klebsiella variicola]|nr:hypothetical protein BN1007_100223 [Klebsiella variicola]CTQ01262.1 hypothetical protein BN1007_100315 [Klebsiella variicola]
MRNPGRSAKYNPMIFSAFQNNQPLCAIEVIWPADASLFETLAILSPEVTWDNAPHHSDLKCDEHQYQEDMKR